MIAATSSQRPQYRLSLSAIFVIAGAQKMNNFRKPTVAVMMFVVLFLGVAFICSSYLWLLPVFFNGLKTYWCFSIGVIAAALCSGYFAFKEEGIKRTQGQKTAVAIVCGIVEGFLVAAISMLILLNTVGS